MMTYTYLEGLYPPHLLLHPLCILAYFKYPSNKLCPVNLNFDRPNSLQHIASGMLQVHACDSCALQNIITHTFIKDSTLHTSASFLYAFHILKIH